MELSELQRNAFMPGDFGGAFMAKLPEEYTDVKKVRHRVEHVTLPIEDSAYKERIAEELIHALTEAGTISG